MASTPLTPEQIEANKQTVIDLWKQVNRPGVDKFLSWLTGPKCDFFLAPASTRFHGAYQGGLCQHSLDVYHRLVAEVANEQAFAHSVLEIGRPNDYADYIMPDNVIVTALSHDLCKVNFYKWDTKNKKMPDGTWEQVPYITINEEFPFGHGEKSAYIVQSFFPISREEAVAIRYHMGDYANDKDTSKAHEMFPLAALLHIADVKASYLTDRRSEI